MSRPAARPTDHPRLRLAFAGAVAVGAALAVGELLAGVLPDVPSPLLAVARFVVDVQPPGAKDFIVGIFGEADIEEKQNNELLEGNKAISESNGEILKRVEGLEKRILDLEASIIGRLDKLQPNG